MVFTFTPLLQSNITLIERPVMMRLFIFIGPESDHWECLSLTDSLPNSCLVNLIDLTLACEDDNSKLVEVVTVTHGDDEKRADNSLVQIWKVKFGHKVFVHTLSTRFQVLVKILKLVLGQDSEDV